MKSFQLFTVLIFMSLIFIACMKEEEEVYLDEKFDLGIGQIALLSKVGIAVELASLSDSRCLKNQVCIWAGSVGVALIVDSENGTDTLYLDSNITQFRSDTLDNFVYSIEDIHPSRVGRQRPSDDKYCVTLKIVEL